MLAISRRVRVDRGPGACVPMCAALVGVEESMHESFKRDAARKSRCWTRNGY